jgi:hypothetical protein
MAESRAFQTLLATVADMFCRDGGLDRSYVVNAMLGSLEALRLSAQDIDAGTEEELFACLVYQVDGETACICGPLGETMGRVGAMRALRVSFVSLTHAVTAGRRHAQQYGVKIDRFGLTENELAAAMPAISDGMRRYARVEAAPKFNLN